ncbi:DNA methyltransferase [Catenibacterium sp.]|uniref:DNA methyltransferase n=1 Tax=Catenibacterium sp. TaxID=2049022 RepID=UPI002E798E7E|nr:DNA methyltransferase [Catenibacterium sp.]MEE0491501.1 DNA methyltransferase [Catenibacterium sp.]
MKEKEALYLKGIKNDATSLYEPVHSLFAIDNQYMNQNATIEVKRIFGADVFSYPKPTSFVRKLVEYATNQDSIILDFFSGSATTAQAILEQNAIDGGKRKFIMVQLPELVEKSKGAFEKGYETICDIGRGRINLSSKELNLLVDNGYRTFKIDDSNMNDVYYAPSDYSQGFLSQLESNIKPDRTDLDLLFGCLLEWGLPLSLPYSSEEIDGCTVHDYNDGDLIACFDENVPDSVVKAIAKKQPLRAVFRDSSFSDSPSKINVSEIFKLLAPDTRVKVI